MDVTRRQMLAWLAAAPAASLLRAGNGDFPLLSQVRLGAEFFLNATGTRDSVYHHFERMAGTGLSVARIFTLWDQIEHRRGEWDFSRYDWIYDAAAKNGILIANTLCSEDPPGWMRTAPFYHAWRDLSNPELRPFSEAYLEKVIPHYRGHPAHGAWLLQNEPGIRQTAEPFVLAAYARWLEKKYGTVEALNRVWYQQLGSFADARAPEESRTAGWADYAANLDWRRFQCDHLAEQLAWLRSQVERHHPGALTHVNPPGLTSNMPASGRDMWRIKPTVHFLGASMHASWHFGMFPRHHFGIVYGFCCDLIRSVSAPSPWWVTELQAGPTVFTGSRPLNPTGGEITRWLWDGIGNGARGIVFWLWHPRTEGNEAGEWALAGPNGEDTDRTRAARAVARVVEAHRDFFRDAKPLPARTAILYDRDAMLLYAVDGWRRPEDEVIHSLMGCYKALHESHVPVDFLDVSELESGKAGRYRVLYLPYAYALSGKSVEAVRTFVRDGGTVWADGLVAWKDEAGRTGALPPGRLADVFGFTVEDVVAEWEPFALAASGDTAGALWRCLIPAPAAEVLHRDAQGRPFAVEHTFGKGKAIYYGTAITLRYLHNESAAAREWIAAPGVQASAGMPVRMAAGMEQVGFRAFASGSRLGAVLTNWGPAARATVEVPAGSGSVRELITGRAIPGGNRASVDLEEGGSAVLAIG